MKKKIFYGTAVLAIAALVAVNINISLNSNNLPDMDLNKVEAVAFEWDDFRDWFNAGIDNTLQGQGWNKDEREESQPCPTESSQGGYGGVSYGDASAQGGGHSNQTNPSNRKEYFCLYGQANCTPHKC